MKKTINWDLILKYLDDDYSEAEEQQVLAWASQSKKNKQDLELLNTVWISPSPELSKPDVEKALQSALQKINKLSSTEETKAQEIISIKNNTRNGSVIDLLVSPRFLKIAAALVVLVIGAIFISKMFNDKTLKEITVSNKLIKEVVLPDGSKVTLDSGSILKYPEDFGNHDRNVFLNGEGYFEVTPDKSKQFIVHTGTAQITVVGTKFNVRAWGKNEKEIVAVVDGKVQFGIGASNVIIQKGQMSFAENGMVSNPLNIDVNTQLLWMKREMKFQSATLGEVLEQLGRWYDVQFTLPDDSYKSKIITIYIENRPLDDILDVLSLVLKLKYEKVENKVKFILPE
jgi:transmembrane sensor